MDTPFLDGVWAAVHTPFLADGSLDLPGLRANAARFAGPLGLSGIFCNGVIGEVGTLSREERLATLEAHLDGGGGLRVGVVVSAASLPDTIEIARHAGRAGAHHLVLMRPAGQMLEAELEDYVAAVVDAAALPAVLFDRALPGAGWPQAVIRSLALRGLVRAVKCTRDWDASVELRAAIGDVVQVTDPFECRMLANLLRFDLPVLYADPEPYLFQRDGVTPVNAYLAAWRTGDHATAVAGYRRLEEMRRAYDAWVLHPLRHGGTVHDAIKRWSEFLGLAAGPVRRPHKPLADEARARLRWQLQALFESTG